MPTRSFPDVEAGVLDALQSLAPGSNRTPADLETRLRSSPGFFRVRRIGGAPDAAQVTDAAQVDVETFATSRDGAHALAWSAHDLLTTSTPAVGGTVRFDRITTVLAPFETANDNPKITRYLSTFRVTSRRQ